MRFGLFYEHQYPRPWQPNGDQQLLQNALEQVELADKIGFDYVWAVEHHFLEEYSHSSAPELFLAAASQRTRRIRLGHGVVQLPPQINHPARVAERIATLDLLSGGRVEFGTGEASSAAELGGFLVDRTEKREQWADAIDAITRMFVEEPFAGHDSPFFRMPTRNVLPKPLQKPHPPLWLACSRRETIRLAARKGLGALSFSFVEPEEAAHWSREYYNLIASNECSPAGFAVNPNLAVVLPMMVDRNEQTALERGLEGARFFYFALAHFYGFAKHAPGRTAIADEFMRKRELTGFAADTMSSGVKVLQASGFGSFRGAIGTPSQVIDLIHRYERAGIDQMTFIVQAGNSRHEDICESLKLFGRDVLPHFTVGREAQDALKAERLANACRTALARRPPARTSVHYVIDELAETSRSDARLGGRRVPGTKGAAQKQRHRRVQTFMRGIVRRKSDAQLNAMFGLFLVQWAIFHGLARSFDPTRAPGFLGEVHYELVGQPNGMNLPRSRHWTLRVEEKRATAYARPSPNPAIKVRMHLADFIRVFAGELPPLEPLLEGRASFDGDLTLSAHLSEMFGGPSNL